MANKKGGFVAPKPAGPQAVTYIGMFSGVWVPEADAWFDKDVAQVVDGDLAARLLEQSDNWVAGTISPEKEAPVDEPEPISKKVDEPASEPEEEGPEEDSE